MARKNTTSPDPLAGGKGRSDEVDQSKGIFPMGVPHPEGAEIRSPGSLGGGPYEESGRGGVGGVSRPLDQPGPAVEEARREQASAPADEASSEEQSGESQEPKGALPPHDEERR